MKGIILAGGKGTRLYPSTIAISKQLLPIYDKPMIYYPLSVLLMARISEILIISTRQDINKYKKLLGNGKQIGIKISYSVQEQPRGIVDAFFIGEKFIGTDDVCLILGDNIFYGAELPRILMRAKEENKGATIFGYHINNPKDFGVVEFDEKGNVLSIEEKPLKPKSKYIVPGLYFYNNNVIKMAKKIKASKRNEFEITSLNNEYLKNDNLQVHLLNKGIFWFDTGTPNSMFKAASFIENVQSHQGFYVGCIEEIAWKQGFIDDNQLKELGNELKQTDYGKYILSVLGGNKK